MKSCNSLSVWREKTDSPLKRFVLEKQGGTSAAALTGMRKENSSINLMCWARKQELYVRKFPFCSKRPTPAPSVNYATVRNVGLIKILLTVTKWLRVRRDSTLFPCDLSLSLSYWIHHQGGLNFTLASRCSGVFA